MIDHQHINVTHGSQGSESGAAGTNKWADHNLSDTITSIDV